MNKKKGFVLVGLALLLLLGGLVSGFYFNKPPTEEKLAASVSSALLNNLRQAAVEATPVLEQPSQEASWRGLKSSFFLVDSLEVLNWSRNDFLPDFRHLRDSNTVKLVQAPQGNFIVRKWPLPRRISLLYVLPLVKDFKIVNNYLAPEWNSSIFSTPLEINDPSGSGAEVKLNGRCIFKIQKTASTSPDSAGNKLALLLITASIVLFLIAFFLRLRQWHTAKRYPMVFVVMSVVLISLRIAMVRFNFPNAFSDFMLFDPQRFASSSFNASLADLLINSAVVLVLCLYLFFTFSKWAIARKILRLSGGPRLFVTTGLLFICFLALLYPFLFIEIIYHNSSIQLEITDSVRIDLIRWVAWLSFLIGCTSSFIFVHICFRMAQWVWKGRPGRFWVSLAGAAVLFEVLFGLTGKHYEIPFAVGITYFSLLYAGKIVQHFNQFTFKVFFYLLIVTLALSVEGAWSFRKFNEEKRIQDQFRFGNKFLVDQDVLGEFLLNESAREIAADQFIQTSMVSPFMSKTGIQQKVRQVYLSTYFDRYDIHIYVFNPRGKAFGSEPTTDFSRLLKIYEGESHRTAFNEIYFVNTPTVDATKRYLVIVPISHHGMPAGFVVLNLRLKKIIPRNVYPELLVDNRFSQYFKGKDFSYAFFNQGKLTNSFGDFNYEKDFDKRSLDNRALYQHGLPAGDFYHIGLEDRNGQKVIVTAGRYPEFFLLTNFSFLFVLGLVVVLIILLINIFGAWWNGSHLGYSARIQLYVYLAFFIPLLSVSITTLSLISISDEEQQRQEYERRARNLEEGISAPLEQFEEDPASRKSENQIVELARLADLDASVYGMNGKLILSSQPLIFENQIMSTLINRRAWNALIHDREVTFVTSENIGKLSYNCFYMAIKSAQTGENLGILSVPFFELAQSQDRAQTNVLSNIITVFAFAFILFSLVSFFISNGLTFPLRFITRSLRKTTLTGENQLIDWNSNDEIGRLAGEYNQMIRNLAQSKIELERVQKEAAWREIAKQVAHEIKNPLTPMKLTLQQMERAQLESDFSPDKSRKAIETLLAQVEILNEIATSFSAFAKMPSITMEKINLNSLLTNVVRLHQTGDEGHVQLDPVLTTIFVKGSDQLLGRVFGNIILNALQSGIDGKKVTVSIKTTFTDRLCTVRFEDNGGGIDKDIRDKVFLPHFSTKRTGSGLGLAIAKQGIEQSGGRIWFETIPGQGTTFFVELPIAN
jgi:two-component system, NtrC family, nitrogen regulation sensor histidine kinase NtrY